MNKGNDWTRDEQQLHLTTNSFYSAKGLQEEKYNGRIVSGNAHLGQGSARGHRE